MTEVAPDAATPIATIPRTWSPTAAAAPGRRGAVPRLWGRNVSPFGLKLEAWLRLADIPYTVEPSTDLGKAPKGKLPYIRDEGRLIGDTTLIIEHLKASRGIDPDAGLGAARARRGADAAAPVRGSFLLRRWSTAAGSTRPAGRRWQPAFFGRLPFPVGRLAAGHFRRRVRRMLHLQGIGRHRPDEIYAMAPRTISRRWPTSSATGRS